MRELQAGEREQAETTDLPPTDEAEPRISTVHYRVVVVDDGAGAAIEAARASEERLRLLGDNLPDSALYQFTRDADGRPRLLYVGAGIERLTGIRPEDARRDARLVLGQILPEHRSLLLEAEAKSARELSDFDLEVPIRRLDGEVRWMRIKSRPRRSPDGRVTWDGVQTDVTERRRIEAELRLTSERLEAALRAAPVVCLPRLPRLPRAPQALRREPPSASKKPGRGLRILVVDDNVDGAETLAMLLELDGHEARIAHDGKEAVAIALVERPDVVLLDIGLPGMNGYEACKAMRRGGLTDTLIVATTGYGQDEDRRRSREAGFDSHQVKPVMLSTIQALMGQ
jgi:PAS domain S-box-containing protein